MEKRRLGRIGLSLALAGIFLLTLVVPLTVQAAEKVTLSDIVTAVKLMQSSAELTPEQMEKYDITGDGRITLSDVIALAREFAGSGPAASQPAQPTGGPEAADSPASDAEIASEVCEIMIRNLDAERAKMGLGPLPVNDNAMKVCQAAMDAKLVTPNEDDLYPAYVAGQEVAESTGLNSEWDTSSGAWYYMEGRFSSGQDVVDGVQVLRHFLFIPFSDGRRWIRRHGAPKPREKCIAKPRYRVS